MSVKSKLIVITRPKEDSEALAKILSAKGFSPFIEPLLSIKPLTENTAKLERMLTKNPQAILVTSKNAVQALASMTKLRTIPIIAVGETTAAEAKALKFKSVKAADGTAEMLASFVSKHASPSKGRLLYVRAKNVASDIAATLMRKHFAVDSITLYQAQTAEKFSGEFCKALKAQKLSAVLFFSVRTAATYVKLALKEEASHASINAICMSRAISDAVRGLKWQNNLVASTPTAKAVLEIVESLKT